ncbi:hypothetical protein FQZ97_890280 [compost metagenome]
MPLDAARRQALGARGLDVVHLRHLQHGRAGHARIDRHVEERQRGGGQGQVARDVGRARQPRMARAHGLEAESRQPVQLDGKQQHRHQRQPEQRGGVEQHGQRADQAVHPGSGAGAGPRAQRYPHGERNDERRHRQQQRGWQAFGDEADHRPLLAVGIAQVQPDCMPEVVSQLLRQGLVQPEALAQLRHEDLVGRTGFARHDGGGIAGRGPDQQEIDDRDQGQHQQALHDAAHQVGKFLHGVPPDWIAAIRPAWRAPDCRSNLCLN